jgi:hypothetical protein
VSKSHWSQLSLHIQVYTFTYNSCNLLYYDSLVVCKFTHLFQFTQHVQFSFCRMNVEGTQLEFLHSTAVEDVPTAIHSYQGKVLIGVGKTLRMYDFGKKKLLKKCENKVNSLNIKGLNDSEFKKRFLHDE